MTIHLYRAIVIHSIRHLWRKRSFWIIQGVLAAGPLLVSCIAYLVDPQNPISLGTRIPGVSTLALNYLVLPFLVAPAILDDFGKVGEILWSGPLDNLVYFAGRFSGLWLALAAGSLLQLFGWFVASLVWLNLVTEWIWLVSLVIYLLANTLGLSVVFLVAVITRRNLSLMLVWATLWVWFFFSVVFSEGLSEEFYPMQETAFLNIFFHNLIVSPTMGLGLAQDRFLGMLAWFVGVSLVALSLALLLMPLADKRRSTRWNRLPLVFAGVSLLLAVAGYSLNQRSMAMHTVQPSPQSVQIDAWQVLSQHTEIEVQVEDGTLAGTTVLTLSAAHKDRIQDPEVVLRLNAGLELSAASDEDGSPLTAERVGDSVVVSLPALPEGAFTLNLAWQGHLHIPYTAFEQPWKWADAPGNYGYIYMPQPLQALIRPGGGYLLRDGDWMPWPWTKLPHQAAENHLEIRSRGGHTVAALPLVNGAAIFEGTIPEGLVVFLPKSQAELGEMTLAMSPLAGRQHQTQAYLFASAAGTIAQLFEATPPRYVVVLPYLSNLVWSGELLLIPDGSGYYRNFSLNWLYTFDATGLKQPLFRRASLAAVARAYLLDQLPPAPLEFEAILKPTGENPGLTHPKTLDAQAWIDGAGRWVQAAEYSDARANYDPRWYLTIRAQGEWASVALWMAIELADETTRQGDLEALALLGGQTIAGEGRSERYALVLDRILPEFVHTLTGQKIILDLHKLAERIGTDQALALLTEILQETPPQSVTELVAEMQERSAEIESEVQP
jgi:hypothetical protein